MRFIRVILKSPVIIVVIIILTILFLCNIGLFSIGIVDSILGKKKKKKGNTGFSTISSASEAEDMIRAGKIEKNIKSMTKALKDLLK